ncbi:MAG: sulfotransferase family protein [Actinomycetota bacterium]
MAVPPARRTVPAFMILGTARSGTTLVQRLASEVPGVVVPPETQFFSMFLPGLLRRRRFPLDQAALREEVNLYASLPWAQGMDLDPIAVLSRLDGQCGDAVQLFAAILSVLAGEAPIVGEKSPQHLPWWRLLTNALPALKIIAVVRDPRAVVASSLRVPWATSSHVVLAQRWCVDQRRLRRAHRSLQGWRFLLLRYEDVVLDAESSRKHIAELLGSHEMLESAVDTEVTKRIALPWEWWKERVYGEITDERISAWRGDLSDEQRRDVESICGREMNRLGYGEPPTALSRGVYLAGPPLRVHLERAGVELARLPRAYRRWRRASQGGLRNRIGEVG